MNLAKGLNTIGVNARFVVADIGTAENIWCNFLSLRSLLCGGARFPE
jgi:hypothetical protein